MPKTAVITGAATGIGKATAILFAEKGFNTVIGYNSSEKAANELEMQLISNGFNAKAIRVDVKSSHSCEEFIKQSVNVFGDIDILINNAGISSIKLFTDITDEDWNNMLSTNLSGVFYCCRAAVDYFIHKKSGSIINVSSMWGEVGASCEVHYSAAKAGVIGLTKALAKELGPSNIRVNCVAPGVVDTKMNAGFGHDVLANLLEEIPLMKIGSPEDIAKAIYFLAAEAEFVTGQVLGVNGGMII